MGRALSAEIIGVGELSASERDRWLGWMAADPSLASPYFHPDFAAIAAGVAPGARLAVFHRGGEPVGFFPHQWRGGAVQPLGAPLNDYHGVVSAPGQAVPLEALVRLMGARSVAVTGWTGPAAAADTLAPARTLQADLSGGWDAYMADRRARFAKFFKDKDRVRRGLERDLGPVTVQVDSRDDAHLDRLIALKQDQYRRSLRHDIFDCGWTADLLRALVAAEGPLRARLAVLEAGGAPMAYELGLAAGDHYHFWFPAYEAAAARYSPGMLLSMDTMRAGAEEGFTTFDFGFEGEPYKKYFCDLSRDVLEGVALRPGLVRAMASAARPEAGLALSVRRRWATIDACETTTLGRVRAVGAAASAMLSRSRPPSAAGAVMLAALCL